MIRLCKQSDNKNYHFLFIKNMLILDRLFFKKHAENTSGMLFILYLKPVKVHL